MKKATILKLALKATHKWAKALEPPKAKPSKLSAKGRKIQDMIGSGAFGCNSAAVARLVSVLPGEKIELNVTGSFPMWGAFAVVVPISNPNSHNYPIGEPALAVSVGGPRSSLMISTGDRGNTMCNDRGTVRPATNEEVKDLIRDIPQRALDDVFSPIEGLLDAMEE